MIKILHNPKTADYLDFKRWVNSTSFEWKFNPTSTPDMNDLSKVDLPFYCHSFIKRPEQYGYPVIDNPQETHGVVEMLSQILKQNQIPFNSFIRIAVNAVHPQKDVTASIPHVDHTFAHGNLIMYLNNAGGSTFLLPLIYKKTRAIWISCNR